MKWEFTPFNLKEWNQSNKRIMFVSAEPNGGNPNSGTLDMGEWFRTADHSNQFHDNRRFYNRCKIILDGIVRKRGDDGFNQFRFIDLKATQGGAQSSKKEIITYVKSHLDEVLHYFIPDDQSFGLAPHIIAVLGNNAQDVFGLTVRPVLMNKLPEVRYVYMPHPSAQTVAKDLLKIASFEINEKLVPIALPANKWFCRGRKNFGWIEAK